MHRKERLFHKKAVGIGEKEPLNSEKTGIKWRQLTDRELRRIAIEQMERMLGRMLLVNIDEYNAKTNREQVINKSQGIWQDLNIFNKNIWEFQKKCVHLQRFKQQKRF